MCYELCGPPIDGTPEDMADYNMWLSDEGPYAPLVEAEEEESNVLTQQDAINGFDDYLNEVYPDNVMVCGYEFTPARALKELDPTAYREMFNNWLDSEGLELE